VIVSHRHKFVFMKTRKTAGTSVEIALSRMCGPEDIITPNLPEDEQLRQELGGLGPQHHHRPLRLYTPKAIAVWAVKGRRPILYDHMPAKKVRSVIGREAWDSYYKFAVERNPWDAAVSYYYFRLRHLDAKPTISEWLRSGDLDILKRNYRNIYTIDGKIAVDKVCRYDRLEEDLAEVWAEVALPEPLDLPRAKSGFRTDRRSYRDVLNEQDADYVARLFAPEIEAFAFTF
jgi:hypothetical protein